MILLIMTALLSSATGPGNFELGAVIGEPTGISAKYWFSRDAAFDGALSWSLRDDHEDLYIHGDFLWHSFGLIEDESGELPVFYGVGGRVVLANDTRLGARFPVGISWLLSGAPIDLFAEIAGILDIVPNMEFEMNGGIGIRYVF